MTKTLTELLEPFVVGPDIFSLDVPGDSFKLVRLGYDIMIKKKGVERITHYKEIVKNLILGKDAPYRDDHHKDFWSPN